METEDTLDLDGMSLLDNDTIPNENQSLNCFSCEQPMTGLYCAACGQKNDNFRRSIWGLVGELFISITAYDGRVWRSLRSLILSPGQMSREYADGARQKWTSPVRLYLAMSLLLFAYVAITKTQLVAVGPQALEASTVEIEFEDIGYVPEVYFLERKSRLDELITDEAITAFEEKMKQALKGDDEKSIAELEEEIQRNQKSLDDMITQRDNMANDYAKAGIGRGIDGLEKRNASLQEILEKKKTSGENIAGSAPKSTNNNANEPPDQVTVNESGNTNISLTGAGGQKYTLSGDSLRKAILAGVTEPEIINERVRVNLPRIMFLMMPFSMLMGAIFIRGRDRAMLFDHLVHAAYIHAFSFLLLFIFIILVQFTEISFLLPLYMMILLVYLPISARNMFGRSWFKSLLTAYGVGAIYTFFMGCILITLIGFGVSDIITEYATPVG